MAPCSRPPARLSRQRGGRDPTFGSALALFMYPHALTGVFARASADTIRKNAMLLPAYTLLLGLVALLGYMGHAAGLKLSNHNDVVPLLFKTLFQAGPEKAESGGDSQAARVMIHPAGWEEASLDGKTLFAGFAGTHDVGCSFRTVSTRGGADVRCQRELCDQAHAAG